MPKTVGQPVRFAIPVQKTHNNVITPITNPDAHLEMYQILPTEPGTTRLVDVSNQFGLTDAHGAGPGLPGCAHSENAVCGRRRSTSMATPSWTTSRSTTPRGPAVGATVDLVDQFHQELGVPVLQPRYFANPVVKVHNDVVTHIAHPNDFLVCYDIVPQTFTFAVQTSNQFSDTTLAS